MRPRSLDELVGHEELLSPDGFFSGLLQSGELIQSIVLWGPPGSGKTTLAHLIAERVRGHFVSFSAVTSGVKEVRALCQEAAERRRRLNLPTILFVDEIHRFHKGQQDAFLPHVERGTIFLIGATTENPSFEVVSPLLSRAKVLSLKPLTRSDIVKILERALADEERGLGARGLRADTPILEYLAALSGGDARSALNGLEMAASLLKQGETRIERRHAEVGMQRSSLLYDRAGEEHFNVISALHKSLRGGDADASLFWLGRMLEAGEDPMYVARRLIRFASEDVGNAEPSALQMAVAGQQAVHLLGMPEGGLALAQVVTFLALAPKSNALYTAYRAVQEDIRAGNTDPVPLHLRNAVTDLMAEEGYGRGYLYPHDSEDAVVDQGYLPGGLVDRRYYRPSSRGFEAELGERMRRWRRMRAEISAESRMDGGEEEAGEGGEEGTIER